MTWIPNKYILGTGVGFSNHMLGAFDRALQNAGIDGYNLIQVSSILPPNCQIMDEITAEKGAVIPSAYATVFSNNSGDVISAAVAVGIPADSTQNGVIMHYAQKGSKSSTEKAVIDYVKTAMNDRNIVIQKIISVSVETKVKSNDIYCAFATLSMW